MPRLAPLALLLSFCVPAAAGAQAATTPVAAQTVDPTVQGATFATEQLEQLVAPIALYPDALLAHVLMAATYPLEVVSAARWLQKNPKLAGDALEQALQQQTWDPSVKSLCGFRDVLARLNDNLDWTQDLGDAFLGQQAELMDAVQNMRRKALEAGTLQSAKEQTVTEREDRIIVIEAADPEVIYVPTYYPSSCYGGWGYPTWYYPPMYAPPPPGSLFFAFSVGVIWGSAVWGGCGWGWGHTEIDIDIDRQNNFIDRTENGDRRQQVKERAGNAGTRDRAGDRGNWQHDPEHRKGVGYKDAKTSQRFSDRQAQPRVSRDQARGWGDRTAARPSGGTAATRDMSNTRERTSDRAASGTPTRATGERSSSFSGSRSAGMERASSSRGSGSRGSGGARGGGGRGGGGRGGRR